MVGGRKLILDGVVVEESQEKDIEKASGNIDTSSKYANTSLKYPCLVVREGFSMPKHKWVLVSNVIKSAKGSDIGIYLEKNKNELMKLGTIGGVQVKMLLNVFGEVNLFGYYDDGRLLEGDRLYVLSA